MSRTALAITWIFFSLVILPASAAEPTAIGWGALVPENWKPPIIMPAPEADGHYPVDPDSLVHQLDGKNISLTGYMIPVQFKQNVVTEFLLLPYLGHHVQGHAHYDANQMIYVRLTAPVTVLSPFAAWSVQGVLRAASVTTADGRTGYTLENASAETYTAE